MICFFFNYTATTEIYTYLHTLSRHDALPISHFEDLALDQLRQAASPLHGLIALGNGSDGLCAVLAVLSNHKISELLSVLLDQVVHAEHDGSRSEEHTSELQSLMRISYAVFCLKKQTHKKHTKHNNIKI